MCISLPVRNSSLLAKAGGCLVDITMTDDNKSQELKSVDVDTKEKQPRKNRSVTALEKIEKFEKDKVELEEKIREIKKEVKAKEVEFNKKLYFLIGKAVWEDLEDKRNSGETEYHEQLNGLKQILKSKIKTKADIDVLNSKELIEH
jgi:hypothetical protein